eukprot:gene2952-3685_t
MQVAVAGCLNVNFPLSVAEILKCCTFISSSGSLGIILAFKGNLIQAAMLIRIGACFDFLDGFIARRWGLYSLLGKQLDSLADLISFGFLPTVIMYSLLELENTPNYVPYITLFITLCSALRLARFNIDTTSRDYFIGLSTTAYAVFVSTLPAVIDHNYFPILSQLLAHPVTLVVLSTLGSFLLISKIPFIAFKFTTYSWKKDSHSACYSTLC